MQVFAYSIIHFLTDLMCAFAMFSTFRNAENWPVYILIYNFCAFALQMLFGAVMDLLKKKKEESGSRLQKADLTAYCTLFGIVLTILGAFLHPAILGIGNALFHVGGGIGTIEEDRKRGKKGELLGYFVAPGALGLFIGTALGKTVTGTAALGVELILCSCFVLSLLFLVLSETSKTSTEKKETEKYCESFPEKPSEVRTMPINAGAVIAAVLCFLVVVLRSYIGFSVTFSWKETFSAGLFCTLFVVLGKAAGGFLSARFGIFRVMTGSLLLAALCYFFSGIPIVGVLALFFFNMTMPVTLYLIVDRFYEYPGFSFGLLTMALFIGFLPGYMQVPVPLEGNLLGLFGSIISLAFLLVSLYLIRDGRHKA